MAEEKKSKKKSVQLTDVEAAKIKAEREAQENLIEAQEKINAVLQDHKVNLIADPNSRLGKPAVILVPIK